MTIKEVADILPGTTRHFKDKMHIIYQGEIPRNGYFISKGIVKAYNLQSNGDEQILRFYGPGDFFPLPWLYGKVSSSFYFYEASDTCELISVTKGDMTNLVESNHSVKDYVFDSLLHQDVSSSLRITALEQSRANEKLQFTLYYLVYRFGKKISDDEHVIDVKLTHSTIANLVGLTRETTATEVNKLRRKGVLSYDKKIYTVNQTKLEKIMGEESFKELLDRTKNS